jgi:hypothetical protein
MGDPNCREVKIGICRKRLMQTGSSETLIGWKSGNSTDVPPWDSPDGGNAAMDSVMNEKVIQ